MLASINSSLSYRRIRAPKNHGEVLHLPHLAQWQPTWQNNLATDFQNANFESADLVKLRRLGRTEIQNEALNFTRQYRDVDLAHRQNILMAGHQPSLFHPGVWYKNFILSHLAANLNCVPINLVVDNDICQSNYVNAPGSESTTQQIPFDANAAIVPYEERKVLDMDLFNGFANHAAQAISPFTKTPVVSRLWPHVLENSGNQNLGQAISKGRHRLESELGLQSLEIPISHVAKFKSFAACVFEIVSRISEFHEIYNRNLRVYRTTNKIKSTSHPVPELSQQDGWWETPFWIWTAQSPKRESLFVRSNGNQQVFSDLRHYEKTLRANCSLDQFHETILDGQKIRPKALMTTMLCRLLYSDMFIHGIGGSKYDQLTDAIAADFFAVELPAYLTITGTFTIQQNVAPISNAQIGSQKHRIRDLEFHPERFVDHSNDQSNEWVQEKKQWIEKELPPGQRKPRHDAIKEINQKLQEQVGDSKTAETNKLNELVAQQPMAKLLNSREYSFCLFDQNLLNELKHSAELATTSMRQDTPPADAP